MERAVLRKVKLSGGFGRWPAYVVADDVHGRWMFSPKGTVYLGHPVGGDVVVWEVGRGPDELEGMPELWLLAREGCWAAVWYEYRGVRRIAVDVCTPPELVGGEWRFVDLELDPFWNEDGALGVADEDEFVAACEAGLISDAEAVAARATAGELLEWLRVGAEPFGSVGWRRFEASLGAGLAPIVEVASSA